MRHRNTTPSRKPRRLLGVAIALIAAAGIAAGVTLYGKSPDPPAGLPVHLPATPDAYLGVFLNSFPKSYAPLTAFARQTRTRPDVAMYYSGWWVPFPARFANTAASNGVVPLIQMDPDHISVAGIADSKNADQAYLSAYAEAVRAYHHPVILSFGHEMNGSWFTWGYRKTKPAVFVAAWRHIVTLFRVLGVRNVTWLWTVNIINDTQVGRIPSPDAWWPGSAYVNWVGIDGYYLKPSWQFAPLFGPTITDVLHLTGGDPILIAETGAVPGAGQAGKIADLFAGVRKYNLLGFVWFDSANYNSQNFGITGSAAIAAFRHGAKSYVRPG
jgi:mannan endo-1,4-beta-mannosidase